MTQHSMVYGSHEWILVQYPNGQVDVHFFDCGEYREEFEKTFSSMETARQYVEEWES